MKIAFVLKFKNHICMFLLFRASIFKNLLFKVTFDSRYLKVILAIAGPYTQNLCLYNLLHKQGRRRPMSAHTYVHLYISGRNITSEKSVWPTKPKHLHKTRKVRTKGSQIKINQGKPQIHSLAPSKKGTAGPCPFCAGSATT